MRIGWITAGIVNTPEGRTVDGSAWVRGILPALGLQQLGHETCVVGSRGFRTENDGSISPLLDDDTPVRDCDVVIFQRWMHQEIVEPTKRARAAGQVIAQDIDDHFAGISTKNLASESTARYSAETNDWLRRLYPGLSLRDARRKTARLGVKVPEQEYNRDAYIRGLQVAELLTVSTDELARRMAVTCPRARIEIVRNAIDPEQFFARRDVAGRRPVIGWVGSTGYRSGDLEVLRGVIGPFLERHKLRFHHGGASENGGAANALGLTADQVSEAPATNINQYATLFRPIDVMVIPLANVPFNFAKSALKAQEASASSVPWIASDLPEFRRLGFGRLAKRPTDWTRHLTELLDPEVRKAEVEANRAAVLAHHSFPAAAKNWEAVLMGNRSPAANR